MQNDSDLNNIIIFDRVSKIYEPEKETALREASFSIAKGEFVCVIGPSGCGKSTVLKIIAGLEKQTSGKVEKPQNIAMVFQSGALLPWLSALDNVALGIKATGVSEATAEKAGFKYMEMMGLGQFVSKFPRELSGGQRQRIGIARALAVDPEVLLLDEPFSSLDAKTTEELHKDIIKIWKETGKTIVMVSHSIEEAVTLADRVILMKNFGVEKIFSIALSRPRRDQEVKFSQQVFEIRKEFFK